MKQLRFSEGLRSPETIKKQIPNYSKIKERITSIQKEISDTKLALDKSSRDREEYLNQKRSAVERKNFKDSAIALEKALKETSNIQTFRTKLAALEDDLLRERNSLIESENKAREISRELKKTLFLIAMDEYNDAAEKLSLCIKTLFMKYQSFLTDCDQNDSFNNFLKNFFIYREGAVKCIPKIRQNGSTLDPIDARYHFAFSVFKDEISNLSKAIDN